MYFLKKNKRGIYNKYRKQMPVFEMFLKDTNWFFLSLKNYFRNGNQHKNLLVYPHYPSRGSTIYKIGKRMNYNITNKPKKKMDVAVYWEYLTFREEFQYLESIANKVKVVNLFSRDISKVYVDEVFKKVFGYSTFVDPKSYEGPIVKKNDVNAKHDGAILQGPLQDVEEGFVYQLLIDNSFNDDLVEDLRVPIINEVLDFVYIKHRQISERFKNTTVNTVIKKSIEVLSQDEINLLNAFCKELKLEYGELDVLRNKNDGKIYVVDVNNTPQGPPAHTSKEDADFALDTIADAFQKAFLS